MQVHDQLHAADLTFGEQYLQVRKAEKRLYSDAIVRMLPFIDASHLHAAEWQQRSRSAGRLLSYLSRKPSGRVLEIGCGNGWLANLMAATTLHTVIGSDINTLELDQARRLFKNKLLEFVHSEGSEKLPEEQPFDFIVFAASIQYFSSLSTILNSSLERLNPSGELHILDTRFYKASAIPEARERTRLYYQSLGFPHMMSNYFHHSVEALHSYQPRFLFNPATLVNRLKGTQHEFPWIRIRKTKQPH